MNTNTTIYLTRHGQDEDNANGLLNGHRDLPLTQVGIQQARDLAKNIKSLNLKFDEIFSSPLLRTKQTAEIVINELDYANYQVWDLLIERDFGVMSGQPITSIEEKCSPHILKSQGFYYILEAEKAELWPDVIKRAQQIIDTINNKYSDKLVLLVTHGDIGKMIYTSYFKLDYLQVLQNFVFGNSEIIKLADDTTPNNCKIYSIEQFNL